MRVGRGRKANPLLNCEPDYLVGRVEFIHRLSPTSGGELDGEITRGDEVERLTDKVTDRALRAMAVDLHQVEMGQAIDQASRSDLADATKIIGVNLVNRAPRKLFGARGNGVEHLVGPVEVMDRAKDEIEAFPILFHPGPAGRGRLRIIIQLDPGTNLHVGIGGAEFVDLIEIEPRVVAIVIRESDVSQATGASAVDPGLEQCLGERLDAVPLRVGVVVGEKLRVNR
jgi:hypothetical protein